MPRASDDRTVTERTLSVLSAFSRSRPELTLGEIARSARLSIATAHRRVKELEAWGALERADDGTYGIGLRLWEVASLAPRGLPLRELALPHLEDIVAVTRGNAQLAVRADADALFLERLQGTTILDPQAAMADRLPLTKLAVGLVLLAHASEDVQEEVLRAPIRRVTSHTIVDPDVLRRMLADVRRDGYATSDQQIGLGTYSVAAPIRDQEQNVVAALGVVASSTGMDPQTAVGCVLSGSRSISRMLGFDGGGSRSASVIRP